MPPSSQQVCSSGHQLAQKLGEGWSDFVLLAIEQGGSQLNDEVVALIASALVENTPWNLDVSRCRFSLSNLRTLLQAVARSTLQSLHLDGNVVDPTCAEALAEAIATSTLTGVHLDSCGIDDVSASLLSQGLRRSSHLAVLSLGDNSIGAVGARELATALPSSASLHTLFLFKNCIGDDGLDALAQATTLSESLRELYAYGDLFITSQGARRLATWIPFTGLECAQVENHNTDIVSLDTVDAALGEPRHWAFREVLGFVGLGLGRPLPPSSATASGDALAPTRARELLRVFRVARMLVG